MGQGQMYQPVCRISRDLPPEVRQILPIKCELLARLKSSALSAQENAGKAHTKSLNSIITDITILILPLPLIWKLHTNKAQKISLSIIFLLGSFVVFTSIYRFKIFLNYDPNDLSCKSNLNL